MMADTLSQVQLLSDLVALEVIRVTAKAYIEQYGGGRKAQDCWW